MAGAKTTSGGPSATTTPSRMTTIRPKRVAANSMSWVMATTDRPGRPHRLDDGTDPEHALGVLAGRRLVEDEDGRVHRQDAGQRDELPTRQVEVVRVGRALVGETDGLEAAGDARGDLRRRRPEVARPERHLALDGSFEELLVGVLEDEADGRGEVGDRAVGRSAGRRAGRVRSPVGGGR